MNFPDKLLTSCTSIEQGNLPSSSIGNIYYISTGIVTFQKHILCLSAWMMGDGQIKKIYWLLMNFPDNLLTSCASIEQFNLPFSSIGNIYYISTGIVTFQAHILRDSSWIMGEGHIKRSIDFLWTFQINCWRAALLLSRATYLPFTLNIYIISTQG
jgi:hypothetical protein